jgi:hypothetical protein
VLQAQDQHPSGAELPGIVNALGVIDLFTHREVLLSSLPKKRGIAAATAVPQSSGADSKNGTGRQNTRSAKSNETFCSPLPCLTL